MQERSTKIYIVTRKNKSNHELESSFKLSSIEKRLIQHKIIPLREHLIREFHASLAI